MCDHRWLNSRLTGLRSHFGHWGRTVVWTSRLKEQVVLAVTCFFAHPCQNKQINNCFTLCTTHTSNLRRSRAPPFLFFHCVALGTYDNMHRYSNIDGLVVVWV